MLSLTSVSAFEAVIGDVADKFQLPCQRVHAVSVMIYRLRSVVCGTTVFCGAVVSRGTRAEIGLGH